MNIKSILVVQNTNMIEKKILYDTFYASNKEKQHQYRNYMHKYGDRNLHYSKYKDIMKMKIEIKMFYTFTVNLSLKYACFGDSVEYICVTCLNIY